MLCEIASKAMSSYIWSLKVKEGCGDAYEYRGTFWWSRFERTWNIKLWCWMRAYFSYKNEVGEVSFEFICLAAYVPSLGFFSPELITCNFFARVERLNYSRCARDYQSIKVWTMRKKHLNI